jgi:predicted RNA-binding Zn ribbon-like protein
MTAARDSFYARGFGDSAPWLDLVNSELWDGFGHFTECLDDPHWLRSFLRYWKLCIPPGNTAARQALRELRALLRQLVEKSAAPGSLSPADVARLNDWLGVPVVPRLVQSQSGFALALTPAETGWQAEVAGIARGFADSLIRERRGHLKICANEDCRWIFVDRTKGNVRRWCSDATCGNRDRVRRARAKSGG